MCSVATSRLHLRGLQSAFESQAGDVGMRVRTDPGQYSYYSTNTWAAWGIGQTLYRQSGSFSEIFGRSGKLGGILTRPLGYSTDIWAASERVDGRKARDVSECIGGNGNGKVGGFKKN